MQIEYEGTSGLRQGDNGVGEAEGPRQPRKISIMHLYVEASELGDDLLLVSSYA
jgi:hypothetical protein